MLYGNIVNENYYVQNESSNLMEFELNLLQENMDMSYMLLKHEIIHEEEKKGIFTRFKVWLDKIILKFKTWIRTTFKKSKDDMKKKQADADKDLKAKYDEAKKQSPQKDQSDEADDKKLYMEELKSTMVDVYDSIVIPKFQCPDFSFLSATTRMSPEEFNEKHDQILKQIDDAIVKSINGVITPTLGVQVKTLQDIKDIPSNLDLKSKQMSLYEFSTNKRSMSTTTDALSIENGVGKNLESIRNEFSVLMRQLESSPRHQDDYDTTDELFKLCELYRRAITNTFQLTSRISAILLRAVITIDDKDRFIDIQINLLKIKYNIFD